MRYGGAWLRRTAETSRARGSPAPGAGNRGFEFAERIQERAKTRDLFDVGLGPFPIRPEIGRGHPLFERLQLSFQFRDVKETSVTRARATGVLLVRSPKLRWPSRKIDVIPSEVEGPRVTLSPGI